MRNQLKEYFSNLFETPGELATNSKANSKEQII
jgi:hypothetical protein